MNAALLLVVVELVLRTLRSVFPHVMMFREFDFWSVVAVASADRLEPDFAAMERRFDEPAIRNDLARVGIPNLAAWLSFHAVSPERFPLLSGSGPLNTAGHPRLEYRAPRSFFRRGEHSALVERFDPLARPGAVQTE